MLAKQKICAMSYAPDPHVEANALSPCYGSELRHTPSISTQAMAQEQSINFQDDDDAECHGCQTTHAPEETVALECGHVWGTPCLETSVTLAIRDERNFPPYCEGHGMSIAELTAHVNPQLMRTFQAKAIEYRMRNRVYCHERSCLAFIPPSAITSSVATCIECGCETCTVCREKEHTGACNIAPLPPGHRQCPRCRQVIEKTSGCDDTQCDCGARFCFGCGVSSTWCTCRRARSSI